MVIGEVQNGPCFPEGYQGGLAVQCWQPPSPSDWKQLILALGVPEEYTPVFEEILTDTSARFEAIHKAHVPGLLEANAPVREMRTSVDTVLLAATRLELSRRLVPYLRELQSEEETATHAIVALAQGLGFDAGDEQRAKTLRMFDEARTRVRGAQLTTLVAAARVDLGLVAIQCSSSPIDQPTGKELRDAIVAYWQELTPLRRQYIEWRRQHTLELAEIGHEEESTPQGPARKALHEKRENLKRQHARLLFRAVDLNLRSLPTLIAKMPAADREKFDRLADGLMFPEKGVVIDETRVFLKKALALATLDDGQRTALLALLERLEAKCADYERAMRECAVERFRILHSVPTKPGSTPQDQIALMETIRADRTKANAEFYRVAQDILSDAQRDALAKPDSAGPSDGTSASAIAEPTTADKWALALTAPSPPSRTTPGVGSAPRSSSTAGQPTPPWSGRSSSRAWACTPSQRSSGPGSASLWTGPAPSRSPGSSRSGRAPFPADGHRSP